ncbi:hypothetical protein LWC05_15715 [Acetobacter sicerae]|uniref:Uncharacterized protein n=1 Tax=Acetobacter sicerae TaxID=85325 RepID=A0ABS8VWG8_9PROT|nr:hypothetical protein [Acetobacter sicerae]MCE0745322.1 hypothetical protein [Acetobacter sicerae]
MSLQVERKQVPVQVQEMVEEQPRVLVLPALQRQAQAAQVSALAPVPVSAPLSVRAPPEWELVRALLQAQQAAPAPYAHVIPSLPQTQTWRNRARARCHRRPAEMVQVERLLPRTSVPAVQASGAQVQ